MIVVGPERPDVNPRQRLVALGIVAIVLITVVLVTRSAEAVAITVGPLLLLLGWLVGDRRRDDGSTDDGSTDEASTDEGSTDEASTDEGSTEEGSTDGS